MRIALVLFSCFLQFFSIFAQSNLERIEEELLDGEIEAAIRLIDKSFGKDAKMNARLYRFKGDALRATGDIEAALVWWKKSNVYRAKAYPKDDYHLAWNHALLSSYYYEKVNTSLAVQHADTCLKILSSLSVAQQKEIQVYRIWNILAQSYKQLWLTMTFSESKKLYQKVQGLYLQSIHFIEKNKIDDRYLADSYHLLGNSYVDLMHLYLEHEPKQAFINYQLCSGYYEKAIAISKKEYGNQHARVARTYFVQGLLNQSVQNKFGFNSNKISVEFFEKTLIAYGVDLNKGTAMDLNKIPNKASFLMYCKHLQWAYLRVYEEEKSTSFLAKAELVNQISVKTWEEIHRHFKGDNTNQYLAVYHLVPFTEMIQIELIKKELGLPFSVDKLFVANQKSKHYDLLKDGNKKKSHSTEVSISQLQKKLKADEVFLDFHVSINTENILVFRISSSSVDLIQIDDVPSALALRLLKAIEDTDYKTYTKTALKFYQSIIEPCKISGQKVILCLDDWLNTIPFSSLLTSENNWDKNDYRQLDYLLKKNQIQYILNPQMFRNKGNQTTKFEIETHIPQNQSFAALPFSQKLGEKMQNQHQATLHVKSEANMRSFLNMSRSIVHLSGHGVITDQNALSNHLVFSDSMLYMNALSKLRNVPSLVVLNTCNSGKGAIFVGEGVNNFARTFSRLGVRTILSNLWEVDDQASNQLLELFYDQLSDNKSTTASLRNAQLIRISEAKNSNLAAPYYWSGHRLIGDEIVFENDKSASRAQSMLKWLSIMLITGLGIWLFKLKGNK